MSEARLEVQIGNMRFSAEGTESWLATQLDKLLLRLPLDASTGDSSEAGDEVEPQAPTLNAIDTGMTLARFLQEKGATANQVKKFLATAAWLQSRSSGAKLTTGDISKALRDSHQSKLNNPAKELGRNIAKGYCEKVGEAFFVTNEGQESLA